eukprot:TRINITY_DN5007_c0_g1_i1.p1 TRINITY_DN5007_c0_g1~~TRINITY_DN5007_c0_g1_i1.p1  ORF type:complete len:257 (+),score=24.73 TRINITY_DN5007_c0_g1_i1:81-851(+)
MAAAGGGVLSIFVRMPDGETLPVEVSANGAVVEILEQLAAAGKETRTLGLQHGGETLSTATPLADAGVCSEAVVDAVITEPPNKVSSDPGPTNCGHAWKGLTFKVEARRRPVGIRTIGVPFYTEHEVEPKDMDIEIWVSKEGMAPKPGDLDEAEWEQVAACSLPRPETPSSGHHDAVAVQLDHDVWVTPGSVRMFYVWTPTKDARVSFTRRSEDYRSIDTEDIVTRTAWYMNESRFSANSSCSTPDVSFVGYLKYF